MNRQKAIDLGFKHYTELNGDEYFSVWRIYYNGEILHLGLRAEEIEENSDFPTRDKTRQGKKDIKHSEWLSNAKKQFLAITSEQMFGKYPNGLSIDDRIFIFIDDGPLEISVENWRVNSPKKEGFFSYEAARLAWFEDRRKNQFMHISVSQAEELKTGDNYYVVSKGKIEEYTYGTNLLDATYDDLENCYFSEKAAAIALKKQDKDLAELAKIGQEIQPEYFSAEHATVNLKKTSDPVVQKREINRIEFISNHGRDFIAWNHGVETGKHFELSYQDGGKTLKIFEKKD
jgi:hypothetical protein